eukprot:scaffold356949_cov48-Prasinocladus_malaysianus.AAC.2
MKISVTSAAPRVSDDKNHEQSRVVHRFNQRQKLKLVFVSLKNQVTLGENSEAKVAGCARRYSPETVP